jgi:hypothetical protein
MSNDETSPATQPSSGSRWEPAEPAPTPAPAAYAPAAYAPASPPRQPGRNRGRLLLAGGAVGIALVAGSGGFALGHASADDGPEGGQFGRQGPAGFQAPFPGSGPQGTFPGQGQPPNGFPEPRDGDDDSQQLPDDDVTPGYSTS